MGATCSRHGCMNRVRLDRTTRWLAVQCDSAGPVKLPLFQFNVNFDLSMKPHCCLFIYHSTYQLFFPDFCLTTNGGGDPSASRLLALFSELHVGTEHLAEPSQSSASLPEIKHMYWGISETSTNFCKPTISSPMACVNLNFPVMRPGPPFTNIV